MVAYVSSLFLLKCCHLILGARFGIGKNKFVSNAPIDGILGRMVNVRKFLTSVRLMIFKENAQDVILDMKRKTELVLNLKTIVARLKKMAFALNAILDIKLKVINVF